MSFSSVFIARPIGTTLLAAGIAIAGAAAYFLLPVSPLPSVDFPTIFVSAQMPGASPKTMSTSVTTPLERHLGKIADVNEMTSDSGSGTSRITLQFNLERDIDGAARDVQSAIQAARADLPTALRSNPVYRKANPADFPIIILSMTSDVLTLGQIYDSASTILQQRLSQVEGVGNVELSGSSLPAVRIELNPHALFKYGIGLEDVRAAISAANANSPKGAIESGGRRWQIYVDDVAATADEYRPLVIAFRNGAAVRLGDVADVSSGVENVRNLGLHNGKPAVVVIITKQPGANVIDAVDRIRALIPELQAAIPSSINLQVVNDTTQSIRASLYHVQRTLLIAVILVVVVVVLFIRHGRSALIPSVAVPLSLLGTFGTMYLLGYSLDNLSLMALTVATGFVLDDAIVVLENITRHVEQGMSRIKAAVVGAREVAFTVFSMSTSLIAVFIPILLMGGIVGRLFREFAVTLSIAIAISLVISLTVTPMMCAYFSTNPDRKKKESGLMRASHAVYDAAFRLYDRTLKWALANPGTILLILFVTIALNFYLYIIVPKGFFPEGDTGRLRGIVGADQSISFQHMKTKFTQFVDIIRTDPAVHSVVGYTGRGGGRGLGGGRANSGFMFVALKPLDQRDVSMDEIVARLRPQLNRVTGARVFLSGRQEVRAGGRMGAGNYQYTIRADTLEDLRTWMPRIAEALQRVPELEDVNSDQEDKGLEVNLVIDRVTASRYGIRPSQIDNTLYDAFGQRQVSTIYEDFNQYPVIMEVAPEFWQSPETLNQIYISTSGGQASGTQTSGPAAGTVALGEVAQMQDEAGADAVRNLSLNQLTESGRGGASTGAAVSTRVEQMVPLSAIARFVHGNTALSISHDGPFVASTISFNLPEGVSLGTALSAIEHTMAELHVPAGIHGTFAGTARIFRESVESQPILILTAILAVYIVLGILYESYVHPITILSTLPSAGVGAVLALLMFGTEFTLVALIGVILLIGIVKKNAIMMIDFALDAERKHGMDSRQAIYRACLLRFRPIMMTTMAAIFGALPLVLMTGEGSELRQPLGISIVGGLILSQLLTLYTTPVVYLYLDRFRLRCQSAWQRLYAGMMGGAVREAGT
ncbi:MAG: efflux RND transporter permease subunit [Alphaproteobacteria bacterium]